MSVRRQAVTAVPTVMHANVQAGKPTPAKEIVVDRGAATPQATAQAVVAAMRWGFAKGPANCAAVWWVP